MVITFDRKVPQKWPPEQGQRIQTMMSCSSQERKSEWLKKIIVIFTFIIETTQGENRLEINHSRRDRTTRHQHSDAVSCLKYATTKKILRKIKYKLSLCQKVFQAVSRGERPVLWLPAGPLRGKDTTPGPLRGITLKEKRWKCFPNTALLVFVIHELL